MGGLVLALSLILIGHGVEGGRSSISTEEDLEFERQLKILNKPAIKSIQMEYGDIYDCVDIYKQPAFDHPLLRNHTIQMRPSSLPEGLIREASLDNKDLKIGLPNGGCPRGTVPIRRTRKEDLIRAKSFLKGHNMEVHPLTEENPGYHFAVTSTTGDAAYYGAQAYINVYDPSVLDDQYSRAMIWLANGTPDQANVIQVGTAVIPRIYGDNLLRLSTYWTADNSKSTGCFDNLCPGFVQINPSNSLGVPISPISIYHGQQYIYKVVVFQDKISGNWWLMVSEENNVMGYWPKSIFNSLSGFASQIIWGGDTHSAVYEATKPPMGSGHFPNEEYGGASFFAQIRVIKDIEFVDPDESSVGLFRDKPNCYDVSGKTDGVAVPGYHFFFGGPGGFCGF